MVGSTMFHSILIYCTFFFGTLGLLVPSWSLPKAQKRVVLIGGKAHPTMGHFNEIKSSNNGFEHLLFDPTFGRKPVDGDE